ncbi:MAG TPA: ISAs1 family transposase [Myxococcota bacterium]|nr:ISAs1 family transposase [Myxococcota bacterium]
MSRMLGLNRRLPDTTMRDTLVRIDSGQLRQCIHHQVKAAQRRKALMPEGLPFGVVAIDGKSTAIETWDNKYAQRHRDAYGKSAVGLVRTLTCSLVSSSSKLCIDAVPIPAHTNEMGHLGKAFGQLCRVYTTGAIDKHGGMVLFELASMDAGMCSLANASLVIEKGKHYLFGLKQDQPTLLSEAERLLAHQEEPVARTIDVEGGYEVWRNLYQTEEMAGYLEWRHLRTVLRVESIRTKLKTGRVAERESRYFISSLPMNRLTDEQWLKIIRQHWAVENHCHGTWDTAFEEDDRPWIKNEPQGTLVVMLLRRMAFNMLALFRSVTQRSEERRRTPWRDIMRWMHNAVIGIQGHEIASLRARCALGG